MKKVHINNIPPNSRLLALGNMFRRADSHSSWKIASYFRNEDGSEFSQYFDVEALCILSIGRNFVQSSAGLYQSGGYKQSFDLPPRGAWGESTLGDFPRLGNALIKKAEVANQRCFVFQAGEMKIWLPKLELARKLFFHAGFLARAAYVPNGLDMMFSVEQGRPDGTIHIHTPSRTGAPAAIIRQKVYRDYLSWILVNTDVRQSFESIWRCLNREQQHQNGYLRWIFNFEPPASVEGIRASVSGRFNRDTKEMLVWEITSLSGLEIGNENEIVFHHPGLKLPVNGSGSGKNIGGATLDSDILVDTAAEPDESKERQLIELPPESLLFKGEIKSRVAYNDKRQSVYGQRDDNIPGSEPNGQVLGTKDDVIGGTCNPGEFSLLQGEEDAFSYPNHFTLLRDIISQVAQGQGIERVRVEVKSLPAVQRCRYHLMKDGSPRHALVAKFELPNREFSYLLEVDTSDCHRKVSTQVIRFRYEESAEQSLHMIWVGVVKGSLRWPKPMMRTVCYRGHAVRHPAVGNGEGNGSLLLGWKERLYEAILCRRSEVID